MKILETDRFLQAVKRPNYRNPVKVRCFYPPVDTQEMSPFAKQIAFEFLRAGVDVVSEKQNDVLQSQLSDPVFLHRLVSCRASTGLARMRTVRRPRQVVCHLLASELQLAMSDKLLNFELDTEFYHAMPDDLFRLPDLAPFEFACG